MINAKIVTNKKEDLWHPKECMAHSKQSNILSFQNKSLDVHQIRVSQACLPIHDALHNIKYDLAMRETCH